MRFRSRWAATLNCPITGTLCPVWAAGRGVLIRLGWATPRHDISHAPRGDALPPFPLFSRSSYTTPMICSGARPKKTRSGGFSVRRREFVGQRYHGYNMLTDARDITRQVYGRIARHVRRAIG